MGGAGSVIIGGLYWKRATTNAAWGSLITGSFLAIMGLVLEQVWNSAYEKSFPVNGQWMYFIAMIGAVVVYIVISLLEGKTEFNLDRMLHRGMYALKENQEHETQAPTKGWKAVVLGKESTTGDKVIYGLLLTYGLGWFLVFIIGTIYNLIWDVPTAVWAKFWHFFVLFNVILATLTTIWYIIGGIFDLKSMFNTLRTAKRNELDDGMVIDHHNLGEEPAEFHEE